jgi:hypothetical protein
MAQKSRFLQDEFDYMGQPSIVLKSKQEPEVNLAQILKALRIRTVLEVVGVQFCRVRWLNGADGDDTNVNVNGGASGLGWAIVCSIRSGIGTGTISRTVLWRRCGRGSRRRRAISCGRQCLWADALLLYDV